MVLQASRGRIYIFDSSLSRRNAEKSFHFKLPVFGHILALRFNTLLVVSRFNYFREFWLLLLAGID